VKRKVTVKGLGQVLGVLAFHLVVSTVVSILSCIIWDVRCF